MMSTMGRLRDDLLHFVAPRVCPACTSLLATTEVAWCRACRSSFEAAPLPAEIMSELTERFGPDDLAITSIASLMRYGQMTTARSLLQAVKYQGHLELGRELGRDLGRYLALCSDAFEQVDVVVPVPIHSARRRERGYNQTEYIARGLIAAGIGRRFLNALSRRRHSMSQTRLDSVTRRSNVTDAFSPAEACIRGLRVLICDDVLTTGATINACATVLEAMGAASVVAATVARDDPDYPVDSIDFFSESLP